MGTNQLAGAPAVRGAGYAVGVTLLADPGEDLAGAIQTSCSFCWGVRNAGARETETPVLADDQFVAWVSVGAVTEGHLLILPRRHVLSLSQLEQGERAALGSFVERSRELVERHYVAPCLFEHGASRPGSAVGCSVDHAHLHVVPWHGSLIDSAIQAHRHMSWHGVDGGLLTALDAAPTGPYLLIEDSDGRAVIALGDSVPSQALRRIILRELGRAEEWDWKSHPNRSTVRQTLRKLRRAN